MTSIDFRPVTSFSSCHFSTTKSSRRAAREGGVVTATVMLFIPERGLLFVGVTDGKILCWDTDSRCNDRRSGREGGAPSKVLEDHKGSVRCICFVESIWQGVILTGAADRSIKMWDLSNPRDSIPCVHSLCGHGGTVLSLAFGCDMIVSTSTDGFLCIWRDQTNVKLLRFPAYSIRQRITTDPKVLSQGARAPKDTWFLSGSIRDGEAPSIFAGDSEGYLHIYRPDTLQEGVRDPIFLLAVKMKIHGLGISRVMTMPLESFIFTLSFDQTFKTLDSLSGQSILEESNQASVVFNGLAWDSTFQDVFVADAKGNIGVYNLNMEACIAWKSLFDEPILDLHFEAACNRLVLLSPSCIRVVEIVRGVRFSELNEHTGPIVAMASRATTQGALLYSASMDNTIRTWDADSLECIRTLKEKRQEITAMVYLPRSAVIITGHENSDIKMWSLDNQQEALLKTHSGESAHDNTISALACASAVAEDLRSSNDFSEGTTGSHETLTAASYDRHISCWKVSLTREGTVMAKFERSFRAHEEVDDEILCLAHSPVAGSVFSGGNGGIIRRWPSHGHQVLQDQYKGHEDAVTCLAADGHFLYSGSVDKTVRVWETMQGVQLKIVKVHDVTLQSVLVLAELGHVASCGADGRLVFWDPCIGRVDMDGVDEIQTYEQPEEFRCLAYVSMTKQILVGCESGKIIAFPLPERCARAAAASAEGRLDFSKLDTPLPEILHGVVTPPSSRVGERPTTILEKIRLSAAK